MATPPRAIVAHADTIRTLQARALASAWTAWSTVSIGSISQSWRQVLPALVAVLSEVQRQAADSALDAVPMALAQQGQWEPPTQWLTAEPIVGVSGLGAPLVSALYGPAVRAKQVIATNASGTAGALTAGRQYLTQLVMTTVSDAGRAATTAAIASRPGIGYTRMLNPPSCSRCVVLAGKRFRWNAGFRRHPDCDCVHVPTRTATLEGARREGLVDDPYDLFESLSKAEQDKVFGAGSAAAIREGGDIYQVVNARRGAAGMYTTEGTSKRGYSAELRGRRLTPDAILRQATSREDAVRLLRENNYVLTSVFDPERPVQAIGGLIRGDEPGFGAMGRGGTRKAASAAVRRADATGVRDPNERATMTEAERRLFDARARWQAVQSGRNPYTRSGEGLTQEVSAQVEADYRRWLSTGGQVF